MLDHPSNITREQFELIREDLESPYGTFSRLWV